MLIAFSMISYPMISSFLSSHLPFLGVSNHNLFNCVHPHHITYEEILCWFHLENVWPIHSCIPLKEEILNFDYDLNIDHWSMFTCNHMIWLYNIECMHTYMIFLYAIQTPFNNFLDWRELQSLELLHLLYHRTIIPWIPQVGNSWWNTFFPSWSVNLWMKIPSKILEDLNYPHLLDVYIRQMHNEPCTRLTFYFFPISDTYVTNEVSKSYILP